MEEKAEIHKNIVSIPLALIINLVGIIVTAISIYLPWWNMLDNTIGPLKTIHLYKSTMLMPYKKEYVWMVQNPVLKASMLTPFLLIILSLILSITNIIYYKMKGKKAASALSFISSAALIASFFVFKSEFERYMAGINESITGATGYLHWGYGLGWKLALVAAVLMIIVGLMQLFQTGRFEFEVMFEKETEAT